MLNIYSLYRSLSLAAAEPIQYNKLLIYTEQNSNIEMSIMLLMLFNVNSF